jgi:GNAT superfamily N-acetyltransferase
MTEADLEVFDFIGNTIHTQLQERPEVFQEKFRLFRVGCRIFRVGEHTVGYGIAHPWLLNNIPPLDTFIGELPKPYECLFIHDVVVLPEGRGQGAAGAYIAEMRTVAIKNRISSLALVSVYGTSPLWAGLGFQPVEDEKLTPKLTSYGNTARYMVCSTNS